MTTSGCQHTKRASCSQSADITVLWYQMRGLNVLDVDNIAALGNGNGLALGGSLDRVLGSKDLVEFLEL